MKIGISDTAVLSLPRCDKTWRSVDCQSTCSLTSPDAPFRRALSRPSSVLHLFRVRLTSSLAVSLTCMSSPMAAPTSATIFWCPGRPCSKDNLSALSGWQVQQASSACCCDDQCRCLLCMGTACPKDWGCQTRPHTP